MPTHDCSAIRIGPLTPTTSSVANRDSSQHRHRTNEEPRAKSDAGDRSVEWTPPTTHKCDDRNEGQAGIDASEGGQEA